MGGRGLLAASAIPIAVRQRPEQSSTLPHKLTHYTHTHTGREEECCYGHDRGEIQERQRQVVGGKSANGVSRDVSARHHP